MFRSHRIFRHHQQVAAVVALVVLAVALFAAPAAAQTPDIVPADTQHASCAGDSPHGNCPTLTLSGDAETVATPGDEITVAFSLTRPANGGWNAWQRLTLETMCDPDFELRDENGEVVASSKSAHLVQTEERPFEDWREHCEYDHVGEAIMTPPTRDASFDSAADRNPGSAGTQVAGPITWTSTLTLPDDFSGVWTLSAGIDPREDTTNGNQFTRLAVAHQNLEISGARAAAQQVVGRAAPTVARPIADRTAIANVPFLFTFAANTFIDAGDTLEYFVAESDKPGWVTFTPATRTFSGTPTEAATAFTVTVTASDGSLSLMDRFELTVSANDDDAFITDWVVTDSDKDILIPTSSFYAGLAHPYNYSVNWGDGLTNTRRTGDTTHRYAAGGRYSVTITGKFPLFFLDAGPYPDNSHEKIRSVRQWGTQQWAAMSRAFKGATDLTIAPGAGEPDLSNSPYLDDMFQGTGTCTGTGDARTCTGFTGAGSGIGEWDVSNVTVMGRMFQRARAFNEDISGWDVSNVTSMFWMFYEASEFDQDLGDWDVSNVRSYVRSGGAGGMNNMLRGTKLSTANYNSLLNGWSARTLQNDVVFHAGTAQYTGAAQVGKAIMEETYNWDIDDGGVVNNTDISLSGITLTAGDTDVSLDADAVALPNTNYSATVAHDVGTLTVTPLTTDADDPDDAAENGATYTVNGIAPTTTYTLNAAGTTTTFAIVVTSEEMGITQEYTLTITRDPDPSGGNTTPTLENPIGDRRGIVGVPFRFTFPENTFRDADGDTLTYTMSGNPSWLSLDSATRTLSGRAQSFNEVRTVTITASDGTASVDAEFTYRGGARDGASFVTEWEVTDADKSIIIPTFSGETYGYTVNWGDGVRNGGHMGDATHTYAAAGRYTVSITGTFPRIYVNGRADSKDKIRAVRLWGGNGRRWTSMSGAFEGVSDLTISRSGGLTIQSPNLGDVEDMSRMFKDAANFTGVNSLIGNWNVSRATNMSEMFDGARAFNQNISSWTVSNVTDMSEMFNGARAFNADISGWIVSDVADMSGMFDGARVFNANISGWSVGNVTDMSRMFRGATAFDQNLGSWDVDRVTTMANMFVGTTVGNTFVQKSLSTANYDALLEGWGARTPQPGVRFDAGGSRYSTAEAQVARAKLIRNYGWTIVDTVVNGADISLDGLTLQVGGTRAGVSLDQARAGLPTQAYTASAANDVDTLIVTPSFSDNRATYTVNDAAPTNPATPFALTDGANLFTIVVTSQNTNVTLTYTLTVTRATGNYIPTVENGIGNRQAIAGVPFLFTFADNTFGDLDESDTLTYTFTVSGDATWLEFDADSRTFRNKRSPEMLPALGTHVVEVIASDTKDTVADTFFLNVIAKDANAFITDWAVTAADNRVIIPTEGDGYDYHVNWGDGLTSEGETGDATHNYIRAAGRYTVTITEEAFKRIYVNDDDDFKGKIRSVRQWGADRAWTSMSGAFAGVTNFEISASDVPKLDGVTNMSGMFQGATNFTGAGSNIGTWDVSSVTDMSSMFQGAGAFNQELNNWAVSSVTDMSSMFQGAGAFNKELNWNVAAVEDMSSMFQDAWAFNKELNGWNVESVEDMSQMFRGARAFNKDLSNWNVSSVTDMSSMFYWARRFNQDLSSWNVASVTDMSQMFRGAADFDQDLGDWDISAIGSDSEAGSMENMFYASALSTANYDGTLIGWAYLDEAKTPPETLIPTGITLHGDVDTEYSGKAQLARAILTQTHGWTIRDDGVQSGTDISLSGITLTADGSNVSLDQATNLPTIAYTASVEQSGAGTLTVTPLTREDGARATVDGSDNTATRTVNLTDFPVTFNIVVVAKDDATITQSYTLTVIRGGNRVPRVENPIEDREAIVGLPFRFTFPDNTFVDPDASDTLEYTAALEDGSALPDWLEFDDASRTFRNIRDPEMLPALGTHTVVVTASDGEGSSITDTFELTVAAAVADAFITTWKVPGFDPDPDPAPSATDLTITIPIHTSSGATVYDYTVNWGDGTVTTGHTYRPVTRHLLARHTYAAADTYTVRITGTFSRIYVANSDARYHIRSVEQWGDGREWTQMIKAFEGVTKFKINAHDLPMLGRQFRPIHMTHMFRGATGFTGEGSNIGDWDVSHVNGMVEMFKDATNFNQDLGGWNVGAHRPSMKDMFDGSRLSSENYDLSLIGWSTVDPDIGETVVQENINLGTVNVQYSGEAQLAHAILTSKGWTLNDAGLKAGTDISLSSFRPSTGRGTLVEAPLVMPNRRYTITVVSIADEMILSPLTTDPGATWEVSSDTTGAAVTTTVSGTAAASATVTLADAGTDTTINIDVTSADTTVTQRYTLTVTREQIVDGEPCYSLGDVIDNTDAFRADTPYCIDSAPAGDPWATYKATQDDPSTDVVESDKTEDVVCAQRDFQGILNTGGKPPCRFEDDIRSWEATTDSTSPTSFEYASGQQRYISTTASGEDINPGSTVTVNLVLKNPELSYYCGADEAGDHNCDQPDSASGFDKSVAVEYAITEIVDPHKILEVSCSTGTASCFSSPDITSLPECTGQGIVGGSINFFDDPAYYKCPGDPNIGSDDFYAIADASKGMFSFVTPAYPATTSVDDVRIIGQLPVRRVVGPIEQVEVPLGQNTVYIWMEMRRYYAGHGDYSGGYIPGAPSEDCYYVEQPWLGCPNGYHDGYDSAPKVDRSRFRLALTPNIIQPAAATGSASTSAETLEPDTQHSSCAGDNPHGDCPTLTLSGDANENPEAGDAITVAFSLARGANGGGNPWKRLTLEAMCDPDFELRDENGNVVASSVSFHPAQAEERAFDEWRGDCRYVRTGGAIMTPLTRDDASFDMTDRNTGTPGTQVNGPVAWTATLSLPEEFGGEWTLSASIDPREDASGNRFTSLAVANQDLEIIESEPEPEPEPAPEPASVEKVEPDTQHNSCAGDEPHGDCPTLTLSGDAGAGASPGDEITVAFSLARGANGGEQWWKRLTLETMCDPDFELRDENGDVVASSASHHVAVSPERARTEWRDDCRYTSVGEAIMTAPTRDDSSLDMTDQNPGQAGTQVLGPITWTSTLTLPDDFSGAWTLSASIDPREDASGNRFTSLAVANQDLEISAPAPAPVSAETLEPDTQHSSCAGDEPHGDCPTLTLSGDAGAGASEGGEITVAFSLARGANGGAKVWKRLTLETMCDPDFELRNENDDVIASSESFHLAQTEERAFDEWRDDCQYNRAGEAIMTTPTRDDASFDMTDQNPGHAGTQVLGPITWTSTLTLPDGFSGAWTLSASIDPREDASGNRFTSLAVAPDLSSSD